MFKDVSELREFIEWARSQKVAKVKVGDVEFEISALGLIDEGAIARSNAQIATALGMPEMDPEKAKKEEEDLLFHSSN